MSFCDRKAFSLFLVSLLIFFSGTFVAGLHYPGGFDWVYTVASALASEKHNPTGSKWFAGALAIAMVLLWLYVTAVKEKLVLLFTPNRFALVMLRSGLLFGTLLGLEKLLIRDLSNWVYKAHEILALLMFAGLYMGVLGLLIQMMRRQTIYLLHFMLVIAPLIAIGITQFWLYLDQRDLGWVDTSWREMGIPFWLSFAFWQWLAIVFLWLGFGLLCLNRNNLKGTVPSA
jgi:hypothetical protein